jgi:hypothetical protein
MKQISPKEKNCRDGVLILSLEGNHNIVKVNVYADTALQSKIRVEYAQNGITSELMSFGEKTENDTQMLVFESGKPVSVSHIYIYFPNTGRCPEAELFEEEVDPSDFYPRYTDVDLKQNYYLDTVSVFAGETGYFRYTVYTSMDGRDFTYLGKKASNDVCLPLTGDVFDCGGREARIIRVYVEYNSESVAGGINNISFTGRKSGTPLVKPPEIKVPSFEQTQYNTEITADDTYNEVYGIIERTVGAQYKEWFAFQLEGNPRPSHSFDYFEISYSGGRILIKGNCGVSLAVGFNHYLKYFCNVNISQVGNQTRMPESIIVPQETIFKETKTKIRYAYNYCTLSYTMAFWGEDEWRHELDWLALNGVNVVLDVTAQEEVWRRFLTKIGYSRDEIKKYVAGPAYYAWAYMANLSGFGGPVHDTWFEERTALARRNHHIMRKLGMCPVLQGYGGMVPNDIQKYDKTAEVIPQGTWCSFERPAMLKTTSESFKKYASLFYNCQREVYGSYSRYFAADPFHEGGNPAGVSPQLIAEEILSAMLKENADAVWIIQSWQSNPSSELLAGLEKIQNGKEHALILDLYAEKTPHYNEGGNGNTSYGYEKEFNGTPWIYCMLNNFGGRLGMHGHLDNLVKNIPSVLNTTERNVGIGITPEASENNPVLYEFLFESVWQDNADDELAETDINLWLNNYLTRRYGAQSTAAEKAWTILKDTVYKSELNQLGQGAPECVINARPSFEIKSASSWGNVFISYDASELKKALELLMTDYDILKDSEGYMYDLTTVAMQVLSNDALACQKKLAAAYKQKDVSEFEVLTKKFLSIADKMELTAGGNKYYMLGRWLSNAEQLGKNADDFSKHLYEINAKSLITTWGSYNQCETGGLHDYSNRQWSGLIKDYYKPRWEIWLNERIKELKNEPADKEIDWFEREWNWVLDNKSYPNVPQKADICKLLK